MRKQVEKMKLFGARLPVDLIDRLKVEAIKRGISAQRLVREAIEREIRRASGVSR